MGYRGRIGTWMKFLALFLLCLPCLPQCRTDSGKRLALVIGNGTYSSLPQLGTAAYEAQVMGEALRSAGFDVTRISNVKFSDLPAQEGGFLKKVRPGDIVFVYYSGYAVQDADEEDDFLLPVDYDPSKNIVGSAIRLTRILQDLVEAKTGLTILMVEGPRKLGIPLTGASPLGLIEPNLHQGTDVIFAMAAPLGETVSAPVAPETSAFTKAVVQRLGEPGLRASEVFNRAKDDVVQATGRKQSPFVDWVIVNEGFCFHEPVKSVKAVEPPPIQNVVINRIETVPTNSRDHEEYVHIEAGKFKMGCVPGDTRCAKDELPQHEVAISHGFWMGRTEVEVSAYKRFVMAKKLKMPQTPAYNSGWKAENLPIVDVSWDLAKSYCEWAGGRLPTEAEWEYAARGGKANEIYPLNSENSRDKANFYGQKGNDTFEFAAPVHYFDANPFNLFDMAGNVWEWVQDVYSPTYYQESPAKDPPGPQKNGDHVMRGGSFSSDWQEHLRISIRKSQGGAANNVGFRCVLDDSDATLQRLNLPSAALSK